MAVEWHKVDSPVDGAFRLSGQHWLPIYDTKSQLDGKKDKGLPLPTPEQSHTGDPVDCFSGG